MKLYPHCPVSSEGRTILLEDQRKLPGRGTLKEVFENEQKLGSQERRDWPFQAEGTECAQGGAMV